MTGPLLPVPGASCGFPPLTGPDPLILILGSFPSVRSLLHREYYGNPKNRFWALMEDISGVPASLPYPERARRLTEERIALWDVAGSCTRTGSADSRIRDPVPNDIGGFVRAHPAIRLIALNGSTAGRLYRRSGDVPGIPFVVLPSTSPANARVAFAELVMAWKAVRTTCRRD